MGFEWNGPLLDANQSSVDSKQKTTAEDIFAAQEWVEKQQKMLDIRKKYREDFTKVMSHERANKVFGAEEEFKSLVRREFQKRQAEKKQLEPRKKGF